jgi:hypothetical protein
MDSVLLANAALKLSAWERAQIIVALWRNHTVGSARTRDRLASMTFRFLPPAAREVREAARYYEEKVPGLG